MEEQQFRSESKILAHRMCILIVLVISPKDDINKNLHFQKLD